MTSTTCLIVGAVLVVPQGPLAVGDLAVASLVLAAPAAPATDSPVAVSPAAAAPMASTVSFLRIIVWSPIQDVRGVAAADGIGRNLSHPVPAGQSTVLEWRFNRAYCMLGNKPCAGGVRKCQSSVACLSRAESSTRHSEE